MSSGDNRLYIKVENKKVCGILKTGKKNLFYYDGLGNVKELKPLCVLDFYVHESLQRVGVGKVNPNEIRINLNRLYLRKC